MLHVDWLTGTTTHYNLVMGETEDLFPLFIVLISLKLLSLLCYRIVAEKRFALSLIIGCLYGRLSSRDTLLKALAEVLQ